MQSGVLEVEDYFLSPEFKACCLKIIPHPELVEPPECSDAFISKKTSREKSQNSVSE